MNAAGCLLLAVAKPPEPKPVDCGTRDDRSRKANQPGDNSSLPERHATDETPYRQERSHSQNEAENVAAAPLLHLRILELACRVPQERPKLRLIVIPMVVPPHVLI